MENLLRRDQILELIDLSRQAGQADLLTRMLANLITESDALFNNLAHLQTTPKEEILHRIHNVKNQFANFGGIQVSSILDRMYQLVRAGDVHGEAIQETIGQLNVLAPATVQSISKELGV
jgi:hypothetical protein